MTPKNSHSPIYERVSLTTQEHSIKITIKIDDKSLKQYALKKKIQIELDTGTNHLNMLIN